MFYGEDLLNIFIEHDLYLVSQYIVALKKKKDIFDPYNVFLAIATNIPVRLKTGFVVCGCYLISKRDN